ncbi:MAG: phospho-sugar mutase, partial [Lachnospiraceae bacterium]
IIREQGKELKIVYTPLHGTGNIPVQRVLAELGFEHVYVVPEQELPDGSFPTVSYPNPEDEKAFALALALAKKVDADVIMATDPDADRLGVYAKDSRTGEYMSFTGNMSGILICEYLMSQRKELGRIAEDGAIIKTIVTTNMTDKVAEEYGVKLIEVLTGFKYIGEQIKLFEQSGKGHYEFGFEESYGCLVGTHARDKDAIVAVMMLCEAAAYYRKHGLTLWDQMQNIYRKYGYFKEGLQTMTLKGADGVAQIQAMMDSFRTNPPKSLGSYKVLSFRDYEKDTILNLASGAVTPTGLPKSNVLYFDLNDDAWVCVRPSGTEPKIKFYIGVKGSDAADADAKLKEVTDALMALA